ncbi:hypothetical protein GTQ40_05555 [Flavobacteriaceae bacterium R38]|nr:hypothetical protein [Flavobacteriaceae bacterium R38]
MKIIYALVFTCFFSSVTYSQADKNQVLILGTSHLANIKGFEVSMLDRVITKLDSINFDVIGIEKMSGELLNDIKSRNDKAFDGITKNGFGAQFLEIADSVSVNRKITFLKAQKTIQELLNKKEFDSKDRMELIINYLAITDLPSAVLQYSFIKDKSIFTTDFEKYIASILEKEMKSKNEYYSLAMQLAIKENLNRLDPIDNFQDESLLFKYYPNFIEDYKANAELFSKINELPIFQKINELTESSIKTGDLLNLYSFLNSKEYKNDDFNAQWKIWLDTNFKSGSDKARYYLWEMRNLSITANIMNLVARNPNKKILVIIGASHTGFIEKYLMQVKNIELLKFE